MPRSGSTLIDQILSSHSNVYSLGEVEFFSNSVNEVINENNIENFCKKINSDFSSSYAEKISKLYFDNASETYTKNMHIQYEVFTKVLALIDGLPIQSITDIGCGTGIITRKLHEHFNSQLTTGIDTSTTMIAHARRHFESDILKFYQKSALDFTDQDNADLVFSNSTWTKRNCVA